MLRSGKSRGLVRARKPNCSAAGLSARIDPGHLSTSVERGLDREVQLLSLLGAVTMRNNHERQYE
jgi:hypothetical protein